MKKVSNMSMYVIQNCAKEPCQTAGRKIALEKIKQASIVKNAI